MLFLFSGLFTIVFSANETGNETNIDNDDVDDIPVREQNTSNNNSSSSFNFNTILIVLILIAIVVVVVIMIMGKKPKPQIIIQQPEINLEPPEDPLYLKAKAYVEKYKDKYAKDMIYRTLERNGIPYTTIDRVFNEVYIEQEY